MKNTCGIWNLHRIYPVAKNIPSLHCTKFTHPLLITIQIFLRHTFIYSLDGVLKVIHGGWLDQLILGNVADLFWSKSFDSPSERHHGCISTTHRQWQHFIFQLAGKMSIWKSCHCCVENVILWSSLYLLPAHICDVCSGVAIQFGSNTFQTCMVSNLNLTQIYL